MLRSVRVSRSTFPPHSRQDNLPLANSAPNPFDRIGIAIVEDQAMPEQTKLTRHAKTAKLAPTEVSSQLPSFPIIGIGASAGRHLLVPVAPRGQHLPIDFFFRALAEDRPDV